MDCAKIRKNPRNLYFARASAAPGVRGRAGAFGSAAVLSEPAGGLPVWKPSRCHFAFCQINRLTLDSSASPR